MAITQIKRHSSIYLLRSEQCFYALTPEGSCLFKAPPLPHTQSADWSAHARLRQHHWLAKKSVIRWQKATSATKRKGNGTYHNTVNCSVNNLRFLK